VVEVAGEELEGLRKVEGVEGVEEVELASRRLGG
jgi:hypothetical protein